MNLLAHAILAYHTLLDTEGQERTGAVMADFFTGQRLADYPAGIQMGIRQHRDIDAFTDSHPAFVRCRKAIAEAGAPRFTAGILADIFWDHALASEWKTWGEPLCGLDLEAFSMTYYESLGQTRALHSPSLAQAYPWIVRMSWFTAWARSDGIERTLAGLSRYMSGSVDLASSIVIMAELDQPIRHDFSDFWPDLVRFAETWQDTESSGGAGAD
ncbi:MAG TPA: ACP phosphodiesterase [bacterium]|nr:ACP phosphodiesterase [bacterium]